MKTADTYLNGAIEACGLVLMSRSCFIFRRSSGLCHTLVLHAENLYVVRTYRLEMGFLQCSTTLHCRNFSGFRWVCGIVNFREARHFMLVRLLLSATFASSRGLDFGCARAVIRDVTAYFIQLVIVQAYIFF
jgi:hypothetical protein